MRSASEINAICNDLRNYAVKVKKYKPYEIMAAIHVMRKELDLFLTVKEEIQPDGTYDLFVEPKD